MKFCTEIILLENDKPELAKGFKGLIVDAINFFLSVKRF
jgi:hypothetical protein